MFSKRRNLMAQVEVGKTHKAHHRKTGYREIKKEEGGVEGVALLKEVESRKKMKMKLEREMRLGG